MIRWLTAFIDLPDDDAFDEAAAFWQAVTGTTPSPTRGERDEFFTLVPPAGDPFLRVQRLVSGPPRIHLDLHADDVSALEKRVVGLGARRGADPPMFESPGGLAFCVVPHRGEHERPEPLSVDGGPATLVDQLAIDAPGPRFAAEAAFWSAVFDGERQPTRRPELEVLPRGEGLPLRLLLQRLDEDDKRAPVRAHLDLACGPNVPAVAVQHIHLGATMVRVQVNWTTLLDPAGLPYCLTGRDPISGVL